MPASRATRLAFNSSMRAISAGRALATKIVPRSPAPSPSQARSRAGSGSTSDLDLLDPVCPLYFRGAWKTMAPDRHFLMDFGRDQNPAKQVREKAEFLNASEGDKR